MSEQLPRVIDNAVEKLRKLSVEIDYRRISGERIDQILRNTFYSHRPTTDVLEGRVASELLEQMIFAVSREIMDAQNAYSSARWLWYLRRLPERTFAGSYGTTLPYDQTLAESLSWFSNGIDRDTANDRLSFPVNDSVYRHLCRYVASVKLLSHLQIAFRRAGKGAAVDFSGPFPVCICSSELEAAINTYDERVDRQAFISRAGLGLASIEANAEAISMSASEPVIVVVHRAKATWLPAKVPDGTGGIVKASLLARYAPHMFDVKNLILPYGDDHAVEFGAELSPVVVLLMYFPLLISQLPWVLSTSLQFGYFAVRESRLSDLFEEWLPALSNHARTAGVVIQHTNYDDWRRGLQRMQPQTWPLQPGGLMRPVGNNSVLVDVHAASVCLHKLLVVRRSDARTGEVRGLAFEKSVQRTINASPWCPSAKIADLAGRHIRQNGQTLTDIDAIGMHDGRLLLVSCKSLIYDGEYDRGAHRVVRNLQEVIDHAVADWSMLTARLKVQPVGDNFDFSPFSDVIGVVCTPFVVYSSNVNTLAEVLVGLRACVSVEELTLWLRS